MGFSEMYPLILFACSLLFSLFLFSRKSKRENLNEIKKTIREHSEKAIKNLEQKVVETEEQVSVKKVEVQDTCSYVEKKIQELKDDGEELNQLGDALNKYRSMLAQLNIATSQAHDYVVRTNNDATKLQELQNLIDAHEKSTYEILQSFDSGVKAQKVQLANIESEIESQSNSSINQIITTRDDSLSLVSAQIAKYEELCEKCYQIQQTHDGILKQLIDSQLAHREKLDAMEKEFEDRCDSYLSSTVIKLDGYLSEIQSSANDKLSLVEGSIIKNFESVLESKKESTLLNIDEVLQSSIRTISLYDEKLSGSYEKSQEIGDLQNNIQSFHNNDEKRSIPVSDDSFKDQNINNKDSFVKPTSDYAIPTPFETSFDEEIQGDDKKHRQDASKKESKLKKKKIRRKKRGKDDDLDILAGIDLIDLPDSVNNKSIGNIDDNYQIDPSDDIDLNDLNQSKNIDAINLDSLNKIERFCPTSIDKDVEKQVAEEVEEEIQKDFQSEDTFSDNLDKSVEDDKDSTVHYNDIPAKDNSKGKDLDVSVANIKEEQKKKLNGTGFGNLLDSYGSNKRVEPAKKEDSDVKSFKPGSIIKNLVEGDKKKSSSDESNSLKDSDDEVSVDSKKNSDSKEEKIATEDIQKPLQSDTVDEDKSEVNTQKTSNKDKNKSSYVPIGEEEEILLD